MKRDWLWDRKISKRDIKKILRDPSHRKYLNLTALLLSRKGSPKEVFGEYLKPPDFCRSWSMIKREMRKNAWSDPRIEFWQAIYEKLIEKYTKRGVKIQRKIPIEIDEFCKGIGSKIKTLRKKQGLTQRDLAKRLGVSQQMISRIEKGAENISILTLNNIAKSLSLKVIIDIK